MFCPKCGAQNEDSARNCTNCGNLLVEEETAEAVAEEVNSEAVEAAEEQAADVAAAEDMAEVQETAEAEVVEEAPQKKMGLLPKILIGVGAAVIIALIAFFAIKFIGAKNSDEIDISKFPIIYVTEDGDVKVRPYGKKESYEIAESDGYYWNYELSKDGSKLFFLDSDDDEANLYYRKTKDMNPSEGKGKKIAKDVTSFELVNDGKAVVYKRDDKLCYSNLKEEKVLDKDVTYYSVSEDGKKVIYEDDESSLYICGFGKNDQPEKVDSDVESVISLMNEYEDIYYVKDEKLYYKAYGKEKVKVLDDYDNGYFSEGKIYILQNNTKELKYDDLFIDDVSGRTDLVDPETIVEPSYRDYDDYDDYSDAWDAYWEEYEAAYAMWNIAETKQDIIDYFEEEPFEIYSYTLYSVDGAKATKLDENLTSSYISTNSGYAFYKKAEQSEIEKVKLSEVSSEYDAYSKVYDKNSGESKNGSVYVATPAGKTFMGFDPGKKNAGDFYVSDDGKYLYCKKMSEDEDYVGDLVRFELGSSSLSKEKVILEDVEETYMFEDDYIVAEKDDGELVGFIKGKEVEITDENTADLWYDNGVLYFVDDYKNYSGELVSYKNGKKNVIVSDVCEFMVYDTNRIAYIGNYDDDDGYGELYVCNKKGKSTLIEEEVSSLSQMYY